jgi:redox-sensing transcriptional repressor
MRTAGILRDVSRKKRRRQQAAAISEFTPARLSVYLRCLDELGAAGIQAVSSRALADRFHLNAAQIRKDLAYFGEFGVRGVGYRVEELRSQLRGILGLERPMRIGIIGAGNLGRALADYEGFRTQGFHIVALFDNDPDRVGRQSRGGVQILDVRDFEAMARGGQIDAAMVTVPGPAAQSIVDMAVQSGVRAILNFSPRPIAVPAGVKLKNVDPTVLLESLSFFLARGEAHGAAEI